MAVAAETEAMPPNCPILGYARCPHSVAVSPGRVFVAYPYSLTGVRRHLAHVRDLLSRGTSPVVVDFYYADRELKTQQQLCKICQQIRSSAACLFDFRKGNPNVGIEFGLAVGKGINGIVIIDKRDRKALPSDLAGLGRIEFSGYPDLVRQLVDRLPHFLGDTRTQIPVATSRAPARETAGAAREPGGIQTSFTGRHVDSASWRQEIGVPPMIRQDDGLWVEWDGSVAYSRSGNLTLSRPLPGAFEVEAALTGYTFGIGWDPGIYVYDGDGEDMVLGVNMMPAVPAWDIREPICVVRTPRLSGQIGRLNFNHFLSETISPGIPIGILLRVQDGVAEAVVGGRGAEGLPLPGKPTRLVVGGFRWSAEPGHKMGQSARYCISLLSYRELPA